MVDFVSSVAPPVVLTPVPTPAPVSTPAPAPTPVQATPIAAVKPVDQPPEFSTSVTLNTATHITHVKITDTVTGQLLFQIPDAAASANYPTGKAKSVAGAVQDIIG